MTRPCPRCGRRRDVNSSRVNTPCHDCRDVEQTMASMHGSIAGYDRHIRERTVPCDPCVDAHREYNRAWREAHGIAPRPPAECGTERGYQHHRYERETACRPCLDAHAEHSRKRRFEAKMRQLDREEAA